MEVFQMVVDMFKFQGDMQKVELTYQMLSNVDFHKSKFMKFDKIQTLKQ